MTSVLKKKGGSKITVVHTLWYNLLLLLTIHKTMSRKNLIPSSSISPKEP
uniref:Uncharacterized protein n=1 Tax=Lepeophtheirus salmonis TaxID=72036 RepID=A0A0K2TLW0_LEPSM